MSVRSKSTNKEEVFLTRYSPYLGCSFLLLITGVNVSTYHCIHSRFDFRHNEVSDIKKRILFDPGKNFLKETQERHMVRTPLQTLCRGGRTTKSNFKFRYKTPEYFLREKILYLAKSIRDGFSFRVRFEPTRVPSLFRYRSISYIFSFVSENVDDGPSFG